MVQKKKYSEEQIIAVLKEGEAENALAESFIGQLRDECLNTNWFMNLKHARDVIEDWRRDYNNARPHTSLGGLTPKEFTERNGTLTAVGL